jgi:hypothetical protein
MRPVKKWHVAGALFTLVVGTLLHFVFDWSSGNLFAGVFAPVNESVWEHLKMLITPVLLFSVLEYFVYGHEYPNFVPAKVLSVFVGMAVIVVLFYTYSGIIGQNYLPADILTFILGVAAAYVFSYRLLSSGRLSSVNANILSWFFLTVLIVCTVFFTFNPPHIDIFKDSVTGGYGI